MPIFQAVGHGDRISTREKPAPSSWRWKALRMAFLVLMTPDGLLTATRSRYEVPSSTENTSQMRTGWPARSEQRPSGDVVVTCSSREVGAIWPPVMPYTPLLTKITVMFSPRLAAWKPSAVPMAARSPSP